MHDDFRVMLSGKLEEYMEAACSFQQFSGAVLLALHSQEFYCSAFGMADYENQLPNRTENKFRIGSITKPITAIAIHMLLADGLISELGDPLSKYFSKLPEAIGAISLDKLLGHSSGLPNFTDFPDYIASAGLESAARKTMERFIYKDLIFEPGSQIAYNNSAYIVLGALIEELSGKTYGDFLQERLFAPLGMFDTGHQQDRRLIYKHARGYLLNESGQIENAPFLHMSIPLSAGGLYSTVKDLLILERTLRFGHEILPYTMSDIARGEGAYSYGWRSDRDSSRYRFGHAGGIDGFCSMMQCLPHEGLSIIVLSNLVSPLCSPERVAADLEAIFMQEEYSLPAAAGKIDPASKLLASCQGVYQLDINPAELGTSGPLVLRILKDGERWLACFGEDPPFEIYLENESEFFVPDFEAQIKVCSDSGSEFSHLLLLREGQAIKARKI